MARTNKNTIAFAETGDRQVTTFSYSEGWTAPYDFQQSGAAALPVPMSFVNETMYLISQGVADNNRYGGALPWDVTIAFDQYAIVTGTNGVVYSAVQANQGVDPVGDGGTNWIQIAPTVAEFNAYKALLLSTSGANQIGQSDAGFGGTVQSALTELTATSGITGAERVGAKIGNVAKDVQQLLPVATGLVASGGSLIYGENVTVSKTGTGVYELSFIVPPSNANYVVVATGQQLGCIPNITQRNLNNFEVTTRDLGNPDDLDFYFVVYDV